MKEFDDIHTGLPYRESPEYVAGLIDRCKENALLHDKPVRQGTRTWMYGLAAAAAATALVFGIFFSSLRQSPMDRFLASLTDEEVAQIYDWPVDDIPEFQ